MDCGLWIADCRVTNSHMLDGQFVSLAGIVARFEQALNCPLVGLFEDRALEIR